MLTLAFAVLLSSGASIGEPRLTEDAVAGVWESVIADDVRVVRMELGREADTSLVAVSVGRVRPITTVFSVSRVDVRRRREVIVEAREVGGTDRLVIRGSGVGVRDDGRIHAVVSLQDSRGQELNRWKAEFVNLGGRYVQTVAALAQDAQREIDKTRIDQSRRTQPPLH